MCWYVSTFSTCNHWLRVAACVVDQNAENHSSTLLHKAIPVPCQICDPELAKSWKLVSVLIEIQPNTEWSSIVQQEQATVFDANHYSEPMSSMAVCSESQAGPMQGQEPASVPIVSQPSEDWLGIFQQGQATAFGGDLPNEPTSGNMDYTMNGESSTGLGMAGWGTGGHGLNEAAQEPSAPFDMLLESGEEPTNRYGNQVPNDLSIIPGMPTGAANSDTLAMPSSFPIKLHEPPSATPTSTTTLTFTIPHTNAVVTISTPQLPPASPIPPARSDLLIPQTLLVSQAPPVETPRRGRGRPPKSARSKHWGRRKPARPKRGAHSA